MDGDRSQNPVPHDSTPQKLPAMPFPTDTYELSDLLRRAERYRDWLSSLVGCLYAHYELAHGGVAEQSTDGTHAKVPPVRQAALSASGRRITQVLGEPERGFVADLEPYLGWVPDADDSFRSLLRRYFPDDRFRPESYETDCVLWHHIQKKYLLDVRELCRLAYVELRLREVALANVVAPASARDNSESGQLHPWQRLEIREADGIVFLDGTPLAVQPEQAAYLRVLARFKGATLTEAQIRLVEPSLEGWKLGRDVREQLHAKLKELTRSRPGAGHCLRRADLPQTPDDD